MKKTILEQARELRHDIIDDMKVRFELEELQKAELILSPNSENELIQSEIEELYERTDWYELIVADLYEIIEFTKYELSEYEKNELLFYANKSV